MVSDYLPAALILTPVTSSTRTFQGTFSAHEESPPTTFREIVSGHEPTSLFPQMSCRPISTAREDATRVARVTGMKDVMVTQRSSHLAGAEEMFPSVKTATDWRSLAVLGGNARLPSAHRKQYSAHDVT